MSLKQQHKSKSRQDIGGDAYRRGAFAEKLTSVLLRLKGYRILETRFRGPIGEIDIIALKNNVVVFLEVKARQNLDDAKYSITSQMKTRIQKAAQFYLSRRPEYQSYECRFDAFLYKSPLIWEHIKGCDL